MENNSVTQTVITQQPNKKMKACKTCGVQIAKSAKRCPSCGAKNKKPPILMTVILITIVVLGVLYAFVISKTNTSNAILTVNGTQYTWSEYKDLYHEYYLNSKTIEFEESFLPVNAELTGKITKISNAIIGSTMNGNMPTKTTLMKYEITIYNGATYSVVYSYYEQNNYDFSHLTVGDKVTVKGTIAEEDLFPTNRVEEYLDDQLKITGTKDGITKE